MRKVLDERGQVFFMGALCMSGMLAMLGLAIDLGILFVAKRNLQSVADSAALAAAAEINYGDSTAAATSAATMLGYTNGSGGVTVTVNNPPVHGAYSGLSGYEEVIVSRSVPTYFINVLNCCASTVSARSVASLGTMENCIYSLATTGSGTITLGNGSTLTAPSCNVMDNSSSSTAVSVAQGSSISTNELNVVGAVSSGSGATVPTDTATGIVPFSDPLAYLSPPTYTASQCSNDPAPGGGGNTYSVGPGSANSTTQSGNLVCYNSLTIGGNANTVTVNPGTYVILGNLTFNSSTIKGGNGVTFYLKGSGQLTIQNGATFNFSAPTSGTYNGILFYQDRADSATATLEGGATSILNGILYFPDANLTMDNGSSFTYYSPIVAKTFTLEGGAKFTDLDYNSLNESSPLSSPRIVE